MPKSRNKRKNKASNTAKKQQEMNRLNNELHKRRDIGYHDEPY